MKRIVLLSRLRAGVNSADYEKWVIETDYPYARGLAVIERYDAARIEDFMFGTEGKFDRPYDYAEVIDVPDMDAYLEAFGTEEGKVFMAEFSTYIDDFVAVQTEIIE